MVLVAVAVAVVMEVVVVLYQVDSVVNRQITLLCVETGGEIVE